MPPTTPLSAQAKAAGHQLYQALYAQVSEGVKLTVAQVQEEIDRLMSQDVSADLLVRASTAEANYRYLEGSDDYSARADDNDVFEPSGRMLANADVVTLLEDAQEERRAAEIAQWEAKVAQWEIEDAARGIA